MHFDSVLLNDVEIQHITSDSFLKKKTNYRTKASKNNENYSWL